MTPADPWFMPASKYFQDLQDRIVAALEALDGEATFLRDDWTRAPSEATLHGPKLQGYGRTRVLEGGRVLEKAGVNFSYVHGTFANESFAGTMPGSGLDFFATGISLVLHPRNPHIPTVHLNYRRLCRGDAAWFGGGADLTPYYWQEDDAKLFHGTLRDAALPFADVIDYPAIKAECDRYFFLPHRNESRGVGGIFFDYQSQDPQRVFAFVQAAGNAFLPSWLPIAQRRQAEPYGEQQRQWQLLRRGRYVEFNLVYDRGTIFGLRTGGRIESILMSLPATASWRYDYQPDPGSKEAELQAILRTGIDTSLWGW